MRKDGRQVIISTVIATIGRPTLSRAVNSVLEQQLAGGEFEVVIVNDSGAPLQQDDWQYSERVQIIDTDRRERSVARNTGAAIARGNYLHFLDDDDWLLPGGLECLWELARSTDAAWLYGATQLVDRQGKSLIQLCPRMTSNCLAQVMAGEWIPLQSSLVDSETFFRVGGFHPMIAGPEDIDLCRRIALRSDLAGTERVVACVGMGREGSTTDYRRHEQDRRWAREQVLNQAGVFTRLLCSAHDSPSRKSYWYGRVSRVYWTSAIWNLRRRKLLTAASRAVYGSASLAMASWHLLSADYWQALFKRYVNLTFTHGFEEAKGIE